MSAAPEEARLYTIAAAAEFVLPPEPSFTRTGVTDAQNSSATRCFSSRVKLMFFSNNAENSCPKTAPAGLTDPTSPTRIKCSVILA